MLFKVATCALMTLSTMSFAQENILLEVAPNNCVVEKINDSCNMQLEVNWQSQHHIDACLYIADKELLCWKNRLEASETIKVKLAKTSQLTLRDSNNFLLAQSRVKVTSAQPVAYRRRLRADWSLF